MQTSKLYVTRGLGLFFILSFVLNGSLLPMPVAVGQVPASLKADSTIRLAGLRGSATVAYDERGVPYIEAANESDLYFAQGYVTAKDRLFQLDLLRRTARGELSEILGTPTLEEDKRHRLYNYARLTEDLVTRSPREVRAALEAYARGVNAFTESLDEQNLPTEFRVLQYRPRPWTPADLLLSGKLLAEALSTNWQNDLARAAFSDLPGERRDALLPDTSPLDVILVGSDAAPSRKKAGHRSIGSPVAACCDASGTVPFQDLQTILDTTRRSLERVGLYAEDLAASNNWVVSGKRSATGKPLLANDPHLPSSAPSIWYMVHLSAPGLRVAGAAIPGVPGVVIGHNRRIAWGITNLRADVQDIYLEKFDKENSRRYMTPGGWREAEVRREEIKVRKSAADKATEIVPLDVLVTRHGPVVLERGEARYALRWTALDLQSNEMESFHQINRAANWKEFQSALRLFPGPSQNFVYADVDGHIGYYGAGRIPIRRTGNGALPYDGATDDGEWEKFVPFEALPNLYDPPSGIIVTANSRIVGKDYPYSLSNNWVEPYRARRIYNLLAARQKLSVADFQQIQADTYSFPLALFAGEVVKTARAGAGASPEWRAMLLAFEGWDGKIDAGSRVAPLAQTMRSTFRRHILGHILPPKRVPEFRWTANTFLDDVLLKRPAQWLPPQFDSYDALLLASYREARQELTRQLGADESKWVWGNLGQVSFPHPLAGVPRVGAQFAIESVPQSTGGTTTVNAGGTVSMRFIADLRDWDNTRQGLALGQSGDPASPHWKDQMADWQNTTPRLFPFNAPAVRSATRKTILLAPLAN
jgi:penicillin amidase